MIAFVLLRVFLILLLVAANAFFAAAEFALVSVRDTRIQQLIEAGRIGARIVQRLHQQPRRSRERRSTRHHHGQPDPGLDRRTHGRPPRRGYLRFVHGSSRRVYAHGIAIAIAFSLITYMHVILGELVPKTLALQRAEQVALAVAAPWKLSSPLPAPSCFSCAAPAALVLRVFGSRKRPPQGAVHSPDELKLIVTASRQFGQIPEFQEEMIHSAIELDSITVREVMVARPDIFSLPSDLTLDEALARVVEGQHSRIPVYDPQRGPEHIVGVLYYKDLMRWMRLRLSNLGQSLALAHRAHSNQPDHARRAGRSRNQGPGRIAGRIQRPPPPSRGRRRRVRLDRRRDHRRGHSRTVGRQHRRRIRRAPTRAPVLEDESVLVLEGSVNIRDLETEYGLHPAARRRLRDPGRIRPGPPAKDSRASATSFEYEGRRYTVEEMEGHRIAKVTNRKAASTAVGKAED